LAKRYAERKGILLNPDEKRVDEVPGLAVRQKKFGKRYCPCRIITGNTEEDRKIICPCVYTKRSLRSLARAIAGFLAQKNQKRE